MSEFTAKLRTCLWFDGNGEEAVDFYVTLFPDSRIETVSRPDPNGPALVVEFRLNGVPYMIMNGGRYFKLTPAASISVLTKDQEETDTLWAKLLEGGGTEQPCAWLVDRFGLSWQVVPEAMARMLASEDGQAAGRVEAAMMQMKKIDIAALEAAYRAA